MSKLHDKWRNESLKLVKKAKGKITEPNCCVDFEVGSDGSISAMVYGENGIAQATLGYNDDTSRSKGAYLLSYAIPDIDKLLQAYSKETGVSINNVMTNDENFINWMRQWLKKTPNEQWDSTHASWTHGKYETYETKLEALCALLSGDALGLGVKDYTGTL